MKTITWAPEFYRQYRQRVARNEKLKVDFWDAVAVFEVDRAAVFDHELEASMVGKRAFSVAADCRVVYVENEEEIVFLEVGRHIQVYRR